MPEDLLQAGGAHAFLYAIEPVALMRIPLKSSKSPQFEKKGAYKTERNVYPTRPAEEVVFYRRVRCPVRQDTQARKGLNGYRKG